MGRAGVATCSWCGSEFEVPVRPGPAPEYCRPSHRQRAYEARLKEESSSTKADKSVRPEPVQPTANASPADIFIRLLGQVEVLRDDGSQIELGPLLRRLLAILAQRPHQVVAVSELIDEIWPGVDEELARRRLYTAVWQLRTLLGHDEDQRDGQIISWTPPGYVLEVDDRQLDWVRFRRLRDAGEDALHAGEPGLARMYFTAALGLWSGTEPLSGIDVSVVDEAFVGEMVALRDGAGRRLTTATFALGDYSEAIPRLEAIVEEEPMDERAIVQLALAHYHAGQPARALSTLDQYSRSVSETGWQPSSEVSELQTALLRRDSLVGFTKRTGATKPDGTLPHLDHAAHLCAIWTATPSSLLDRHPAELLLLLQTSGGNILSAGDTSAEVSFTDLETALGAATDLQSSTRQARIQVGIDVSEPVSNPFDGPPRVRARELATAAHAGQVLVTGTTGETLRELVSDPDRVRPLGSHRLTLLTPPVLVFQVTSADVPRVLSEPRWLEAGKVKNLPEESHRLVGRQQEVDTVIGHLSESRLVTLVGPPGGGKTSIAAHVARGLSREYPDGAWFIDLTSVSQSPLMPVAVIEGLGIPVEGGRDPGAILTGFLRRRRTLLVLDNCEHVLSPCRKTVRVLLAECPQLSIITTSREALSLDEERVVSILPFDPPKSPSVEEIEDNPAARLFLDRYGSRSDGSGRAEVAPGEADPVVRICRAVDGLPLSLVLAAARAREFGVSNLADTLEDEPREGLGLGVSSRDVSADRHSLFGTLEWSYRLLSDEERSLFDALSVFQAPFTLNDAIAISHDRGPSSEVRVSALRRLVKASLVDALKDLEGHSRFRMLQPIREFAAIKLEADSELSELVHVNHAKHFLGVAEEAEPQLRGPQDKRTMDRLESCLPDLRSSIQWALHRGQADIALRLVGSLWLFWYVRGLVVEGKTLTEAALELDESPSHERVKALVAMSHFAWLTGDLKTCREVVREALMIVEALGGDWGWAWVQLAAAGASIFDVEDDSVPLRLVESIQQFRSIGNDWDTAFAMEVLGNAAFQRGDYERAEKALSESLALYWALGTPTMQASVLAHGLMLALLGHLEEGAREVDEAIEAAYETGEMVHLAWALCHRAAIARYAGQHEESRRRYRDAVRVAAEAENVWAMEWAMAGLGNTQELGLDPRPERVEAALRLLAKSEAIGLETGLSLAPRERDYLRADLGRARDLLDERVFEAAMSSGRRMSIEEAVDQALNLDVSSARLSS